MVPALSHAHILLSFLGPASTPGASYHPASYKATLAVGRGGGTQFAEVGLAYPLKFLTSSIFK